MVDNCLIQDCRASKTCNGHSCKGCGWNPEENRRRRRQMEIRGLTTGSDGLRRLVLRRRKRAV